MSIDSYGARDRLEVGGKGYEIFRTEVVEGADTLPFSLKVLLENLLRTEDGANVTAEDIAALGRWNPADEPNREIQFTPARVIMQDFTGVPCVVDLATMREAMADLGGDPARVNPLAPAEMVIDHSVVADLFGTPNAFTRNVELEYQRVAYPAPCILLMGSERLGLSPAEQEPCDLLVRIPMAGTCDSLNLGVATSIMLYEIFQQGRGRPADQ